MKFLLFVIYLSYIHVSECDVPKEIACHAPNCAHARVVGCEAYHSRCNKVRRELRVTEEECGCLWKSFIQGVEPQSRVIFTDQGRQCFTWAAQICHQLALPAASGRQSAVLSVIQLLKEIDTGPPPHYGEVVKSRRRPAVVLPSSESQAASGWMKVTQKQSPVRAPAPKRRKYFPRRKGWWVLLKHRNRHHKVHKPRSRSRVAVSKVFVGTPVRTHARPEYMVKTEDEIVTVGPKVKRVQRKRHHWYSFNLHSLPDEQFKLAVFIIILLLNILCVVLTILCRSETRSSSKEARPSGDLNPDMYKPAQEESQRSSLQKFIDKLRFHKTRKEQSDSMRYFGMDSIPHDQVHMDPQYPLAYSSPNKTCYKNESSQIPVSSDLYGNLKDESFDLDLSYEEPLNIDREHFSKHFSTMTGEEEEERYMSPNITSRDTSVSHTDEPDKVVSFELPHNHALGSSAEQLPVPRRIKKPGRGSPHIWMMRR